MNALETIQPATPGEVQAFYQAGMEQLDQHLLKGESEAKLGALVAMASGLNVVFFGAPGGGKTTLGEHMYRLVGDIREDDVAVIPPQADLTAQILVGGELHAEKVVTTEGTEVKESISTKIDPIIHPWTKVIWANEINRTNQYAFNTALEAYEAGKIDHTGGRVNLDLTWSASSMNPGEKRDGTFPITVAMASRHAIGASMGVGSQVERDEIVDAVLSGWEPTPDRIESITTLGKLKQIRAHIESSEGVAFPETERKHARDLVGQTQQALKDNKIDETDNRLAKHTRKVAKTLASLNGQNAVREEDLLQAIRFVASARLGMLSVSQAKSTEVVNSIVPAQLGINMVALPETAHALDSLAANGHFGVGEHRAHMIQAGVPGLQLGYEAFDPRRHQTHQIDVLAPFTDFLGEEQVQLVRPERPLLINVITDYSSVNQHPVLSETKSRLAEDLGDSIAEALPGMNDRVRFFAVGDGVPRDLGNEVEIIEIDDTEVLTKEIDAIAMDGLTFVVGSFNRLKLAESRRGGEVVAVKVNHPLDRRIPANIGIVGIQGLGEVNTRKSKSLGLINDRLELRHQGIVRELEDNGVVVASVVAALQNPSEYDIQAADAEIASAIASLQ